MNTKKIFIGTVKVGLVLVSISREELGFIEKIKSSEWRSFWKDVDNIRTQGNLIKAFKEFIKNNK